MKRILLSVLLMLLAAPGLLFAEAERPSCQIMGKINLKPLLGADHDAPVPFGEDGCRAESGSPGRMVILTVTEGTPDELKNWLAGIRKINTEQRAAEVILAAEPALGPDAFSIKEKGDELRQIELYALKGSRAVVVQATWSIGEPITDATFKKLRHVAKAALAKLP